MSTPLWRGTVAPNMALLRRLHGANIEARRRGDGGWVVLPSQMGGPDTPPTPANWDEVILDGDSRVYVGGPDPGMVRPMVGYGDRALPPEVAAIQAQMTSPLPAGRRPRAYPAPAQQWDPNDPRLGTPMVPLPEAPPPPPIDTGYISSDTRRKTKRRNENRKKTGKPPLNSGGYQHPTGGRKR